MKTQLIKILRNTLVIAVCCWSTNLMAQPALVPSANNSYVGLEKNVLFNAGARYSVTQTGTRQFDPGTIFDGSFYPYYLGGFDGTPASAVVIDIAGLPDYHTQLGAYVGFTTRYLAAKRFKIEGYDTYGGVNTWRVIANEINNTSNTYAKAIPVNGAYTKLRFTFYEANELTGSNAGIIGIGELFFLHSEAVAAYDGLMVQYAANGSVGIGTSLPDASYKLNVKGKIRAQEIKVELANWPDFVFAKNYQLPSLQATENHIKRNGHLPGIPSAAEVAKDGIELGEMNKKLLQKIEELTLYLIEMKKDNGKQDKQIRSLSDSNKKLLSEIEKIKTKP